MHISESLWSISCRSRIKRQNMKYLFFYCIEYNLQYNSSGQLNVLEMSFLVHEQLADFSWCLGAFESYIEQHHICLGTWNYFLIHYFYYDLCLHESCHFFIFLLIFRINCTEGHPISCYILNYGLVCFQTDINKSVQRCIKVGIHFPCDEI